MKNDPEISDAEVEEFDRANKFFHSILDKFSELYNRWMDERLYEDFSDYEKAAKTLVEGSGFEFISLKENPFCLTFKGMRVHCITVVKDKILLSYHFK